MILEDFEENDENRRCYRHPSHLSISVMYDTSDTDTLCSLKDISLSGMAYRSGHESNPGERITVRFPESTPCCEIYGRVVWSRRVNGVYEMGVEFSRDDNKREVIEKIISDVAHIETLRVVAA